MKASGEITNRYVIWADFTDPKTFPDDFLPDDKIYIKVRDGGFTMTLQQFKDACQDGGP